MSNLLCKNGCFSQFLIRSSASSRHALDARYLVGYGVIAIFKTPSRWLENRSYAASMSSSLYRCVTSGVRSTRSDRNNFHQPPHALFAARTERCNDGVVTEPGSESAEWYLKLG